MEFMGKISKKQNIYYLVRNNCSRKYMIYKRVRDL